jgi:hypothetical protein
MVTGVGHGCTACQYSPDEYNDVEVIAAGTRLNRFFSNNMEVVSILFAIFMELWPLDMG